MKKMLFTLASLLAFYGLAIAQPSDKKAGKVYSETTITQYLDHVNAPHIGSLMQDFSAVGAGGRTFNNESLKNKVTVLVFWYPSCHCYNFKELDSLGLTFQKNKVVQIAAMGADSSELADYKRSNYLPYPYYSISSYSDLHHLNYKNGLPCIFIINRDGIVTAIKAGPEVHHSKEVMDAVRNALL